MRKLWAKRYNFQQAIISLSWLRERGIKNRNFLWRSLYICCIYVDINYFNVVFETARPMRTFCSKYCVKIDAINNDMCCLRNAILCDGGEPVNKIRRIIIQDKENLLKVTFNKFFFTFLIFSNLIFFVESIAILLHTT